MPFINGKYSPKPKEAPPQPPTPEELEQKKQERERAAAESAAAFEKLISTDTPDLTGYNQLVEKEKQRVKRTLTYKGKAKLALTVLLIACIFVMFLGISFASAPIVTGALIAAVIGTALYFIIIPR